MTSHQNPAVVDLPRTHRALRVIFVKMMVRFVLSFCFLLVRTFDTTITKDSSRQRRGSSITLCSFTTIAMKAALANIRVLVRVPPLNERVLRSNSSDGGVLQISNNADRVTTLRCNIENSNQEWIRIDQAYLSQVCSTHSRRASSAAKSRSFTYDAVFGPR